MNKYAVLALMAGVLWGTTGLFTRTLGSMGLVSLDMLLIRCALAALIFFVIIAIKNPARLKIKTKDLPLFLAVALAGQFMFSFFYYTAIDLMSLSAACTLAHLSPALVMILAHFIFKEKIGRKGVLSVVLCIVGCAMVSGFDGTVSPKGFLYAMGSAVGFALLNVFNRLLQKRGYSGMTVNLYLCLFAAIAAICVCGVKPVVTAMTSSVPNFLFCLTWAVFSGVLPYLCFSTALSKCESGMVSILGSSEVVVSALLGVILYREGLDFLSLLGMVLVLGSIVLMNTKKKACNC
jgi:drug/metabolite transporter (DMT)-like permease